MERSLARLIIEKNGFHRASEENLLKLAAGSEEKTFAKDGFIYTPSEKTGFIYIILDGTVEMFGYTQNRAQKKSFSILNRGNIFGYGEIAEEHHTIFAQCLTDTTVLAVSQKRFLDTVCACPDLSLEFLSSLAHQVSQQHRIILMDDARMKVMNYLCWLCEHFSDSAVLRTEVPRKLTYEQIGDTLFLTRETVIRTLRALENEGVIEIRKKSFLILRPDLIRENRQLLRTNIFPAEK